MRNFEKYSSFLLSEIKEKRVKNFLDLTEQIFSKHSIQLWKLSTDKKTYRRYRDMLNARLLNGTNSNQLNVSLLQSKLPLISGKDYGVLVHGGCDMRKAHSKGLERLG